VIIHKHQSLDSEPYITVSEALPIEQIALEIFESPNPWLSIRDFSDDSDGVHGQFTIKASNGTWTYQFTRKLWWLDGVYEAKLIHGDVLHDPVATTGA